MNYSKVNISIVILFIFHVVGVVGLSSDYQDLFLRLTPLNLLLSLGLFIWANNDFSVQFYKVVAILFALGFLVEVIGVSTGVLFGEYTYAITPRYIEDGVLLPLDPSLTVKVAFNKSTPCFAQKVKSPEIGILPMSDFNSLKIFLSEGGIAIP